MRCTLFLVVTFTSGAVPAEPEPLVTIKPGNLPIILSAPHGGREAAPGVAVRKGQGVDQFVMARDDNTTELVELIAQELEKRLGARPYLVIARFERQYIDANRHEKAALESEKAKLHYWAYHRAIEDFSKEIQKKWKQGLLLDVHGQGKLPNVLARGTGNGQTVELLIQRHGKEALVGPKSLFGSFAGMGYNVHPPIDSDDKEDPRYNGGYTVRTYGSHQGHGIDAIQLEFGSELRRKDQLAKTATAIGEAINVFCRTYMNDAIPKK